MTEPAASRAAPGPHLHRPAGGGRALLLALVLTAGFAVVELVAGWLSGSPALIGDAAHMVTDATALGLAALAAHFSRRPPSERHSFGLQRAEILGARVNAGLMLVVVAWIGHAAIERLRLPNPVHGPTVLAVAALGLAMNLVVLQVLRRGEHDLNTRGAALHVLVSCLVGSQHFSASLRDGPARRASEDWPSPMRASATQRDARRVAPSS